MRENPGAVYKGFDGNRFGDAMRWVDTRLSDSEGAPAAKRLRGCAGGARPIAEFRPLGETVAQMPGIEHPVAPSAIETAHRMEQRYGGQKQGAYEPWWDEASAQNMSSVEYTQMMHQLWHTETSLGM